MAVCHAALVAVSFAIAPFSPLERRQPGEIVVFQRMIDLIPLPSSIEAGLISWTEGQGVLGSRPLRAALYLFPFAMLCALFATMVILLLRSQSAIDERTVQFLFRLAIALALIRVLSWPDFTWDFWLSIGWGRMIANGVNPYYVPLTPRAMAGLPFGPDGDRMTYGPLWAWLSGLVGAVAGSSIMLSFVLGKALLLAAWTSTLWLVRRIAAQLGGTLHTAVVVCLFGLMPASIRYSVAEGHNDIVMVAAFTMWVYLVLRRSHWLSPLALTASFLVKYVTGPFALLELAAARRHRAKLAPYLAVLLFCLSVVMVLFVPFFRDPSMFHEAARMRRWLFWTPASVLEAVLRHLGLPVGIPVLNLVVLAGFLVVLGYAVWRYHEEGTGDAFLQICLLGLATILFTTVGHVWPWFSIWILPFAALAWRSPAGQAGLAFCLSIPILDQGAYLGNNWNDRSWFGLALYTVTVVLTIGMWTSARARGPLIRGNAP